MSPDVPLDKIGGNGEAAELEMQTVAFFESLHQKTVSGLKEADITYGDARMTLGLQPIGEGDRSLVYSLRSISLGLPDARGPLCLKVAKQQQICRDLLLQEGRTTELFRAEGIVVPRIYHLDAAGRFAVKEFVDGESITSLYMRFNALSLKAQKLVLRGLEGFLNRLIELFRKKPECKVSISPNNIYVKSEGGKFPEPVPFVLIDPGPTPSKSYEGFTFDRYWNEILPDRIRKYQRTGYLQWLVPREVNQSERDEVKEFEIFSGLKPAEIFLLLKIAKTVEFDAEEVILREGAVGENFYLVLDGEVELRKGHYSKSGTWGPRIGRGLVLGEMAFLLQIPRSMTAVAATSCKLIEIDRDGFNELLDAGLTAPYKLIKNIATILAERLHTLNNVHQELIECRADVLPGKAEP
jgi:CRP/FNR family transcriptional regulator, cyclic AMP receptor protein